LRTLILGCHLRKDTVKVENPKTLTAISVVEGYKPDKDHPRGRVVRDPACQGLYLVVGPEPHGRKHWLLRVRRPDGRMGKIVLGRLDTTGQELKTGEVPPIGMPLTLRGAHALVADLHRQRANGVDIVANHKAKKRRVRTVAVNRSNTFPSAVKDFIEDQKGKVRGWRDTAKLLGLRYLTDGGEPTVIAGGLCDLWSDKSLREIDGELVHGVVIDARKIGVPGLVARTKGKSENRARLFFVALSSLFSWALKQDERPIDVNPCASVSSPEAAKKRTRVLTKDEIRFFWRACDELGAPFGSIYKICLLTGARLNEVVRMTRAELSEDLSTWSLEATRTKNKLPHLVPLPLLAQSIIGDVPRIEGPYVFSFTGTKPASGGSRLKARLDAIMTKIAGHPITPFRIHDTRRTAVTGMAELEILPNIVELVVNHISGFKAGVAGTYNRAQLLPQRKAALELWAAHIAGLVSGESANVTPISKGRGHGRH
jgi:integrase